MILVTGGAGYIGSVLVRRLLRDGFEVAILDSLRYGGQSLLGLLDEVHFIYGDIRDQKLLAKALKEVNAVVHLAALVGPVCDKFQDEAVEINLEAVHLLARSKVPRILFASTCSNYGRSNEMASEEHPLQPLGLYASTKVAAEEVLLSAHPQGLTIMRFATAYGLSPRTRLDLLLHELAVDAVKTGKLLIYNPDSWRPFAHVEDIARFIAIVLSHSDMTGIYNVGGHNRRKSDLAGTLKKLVPGLEVSCKKTGSDPRDYQVSFEKVRKAGFKPLFTPEDGLAELVQALKWDLFRTEHRNDTTV